MRNVFDQYQQPENRLTHALLSSLRHDQRLARRFVKRFAGRNVSVSRLQIGEQALPGERELLTEDEAASRGLPDGYIVDDQGWTLLIESKIRSRVNPGQLERHLATAVRRGVSDVELMVLTTGHAPKGPTARVRYATWTDIYGWLREERAKSTWARICGEYFEAAEIRLPQDGYLVEGTLTVFSGIPFGRDEPYNYQEAKRLLELLRVELLKRRKLVRLGIDQENEGRKTITGVGEALVWDYVALKRSRRSAIHTKYPHLTFAIGQERAEAYVTVPNAVTGDIRKRIFGAGKEAFIERIQRITSELGRVTKRYGGMPMVVVVQRRYRTQRSVPIREALLRFDPRTAFRSPRQTNRLVRYQPEWLDAVYHAMTARHSNLQFQIGADFPYSGGDAVRSERFIDAVEAVWLACDAIFNP